MPFGSQAGASRFGVTRSELARFSRTAMTLTLALVVAILALCILDGILTIELLDRNSEEINPVMRFLLDRGHGPFLLGKYAITAAGLPFLVVYKNWPIFGTRFRTGYLLPVFLVLYLTLLIYQLYLLGH